MRRVDRGGLSEYFFNGQPCRLKDNPEAVHGHAGIGRSELFGSWPRARSTRSSRPSPEERRAVFEEAAGITKYKSLRREALGKLAPIPTKIWRAWPTWSAKSAGRSAASAGRRPRRCRYKRLSHRLRHLQPRLQPPAAPATHAAELGRLEAVVGELRASAPPSAAPAASRPASAGVDEKKAAAAAALQSAGAGRVQQAVFDLRSQKRSQRRRTPPISPPPAAASAPGGAAGLRARQPGRNRNAGPRGHLPGGHRRAGQAAPAQSPRQFGRGLPAAQSRAGDLRGRPRPA